MLPLIICKSHYTFLKGIHSPSELVDFARKKGVKTLCLADKNGLYGAVEFYIRCREANIQPLIATELVQDKRHVTIVARNGKGYEELCRLVTQHHLENLKIDAFPDSLNLLTLCRDPFLLQRWLLRRKGVERNNLFLALSLWDRESLRSLLNLLSRRSDLTRVPAVPVIEWNLLDPSDEPLRNVLRAIDLNCTVETLPEKERFVGVKINPEEISYEPMIPGDHIARLCRLELDLERYHLPRFIPES
ncbi:MAG: PHP domain-containing protein [Candidatus Neomarinimicrobiota bacterium]